MSKVYKAGEVCELAQVQPYVLRSWEKEFPGIGIQKTPESPRLYRQSDLEHVQRIKQLVFSEGLTVAGARRRLEESAPPKGTAAAEAAEAADVLEAISADARSRLRRVRDGLREIQTMLLGDAEAPRVVTGGTGSRGGKAPRVASRVKARPALARAQSVRRPSAAKTSSARRKAKPLRGKRGRR